VKSELKQSTRVVVLFFDIALLVLFSDLAFGRFLPPVGQRGLWFYTALLSLLLGSRLVTPFYTKPADVVAYSISALVALFLVSDWGNWGASEHFGFFVASVYCAILAIASFLQIFTKDSQRETLRNFSNSLRVAVGTLGDPRVTFSVVMWFAIYTFHRNAPRELLWITAAWATTVAFSPVEGLLKLGKKLRYHWLPGRSRTVIGEVVAYQNPNVVLLRQVPGVDPPFGSPFVINDPHAPARVAIALDYVGRDEGVLRRAVEVDVAVQGGTVSTWVEGLPYNVAAKMELTDLKITDKRSETIFAELGSIVGIVAPETSIDRLYFEVIKEEELEEGRLVDTLIGERSVVYQVVNGLTKEEVVQRKNTYGYARAQAQKIGVWRTEERRFELAKWLPMINAPVFLKQECAAPTDPDSIGCFPRTNYTVGIKNIHDLVTHNTAILGILGVGKSMLGIELLERMMARGIKIICLDLTNQYATELSEYYDQTHEEPRLRKIMEAGQKDCEKWADDPEQGGSLPAFSQAITNDLAEFLAPDNPRMLKIYNPGQLFATKQLSDPKSFTVCGQWQRRASVWTVTAVEVTRVVSEAALEILKDEMVDYARACLVFEEAHSLVPEWTAVASEGDRAATNRTARAILQGRKFGLGCLVVTQRTASVTKTILNQCNTVFAMRTFDETGKEFLSNYIGKDYAASLSSIPERHAVFFGRASTCENPVLIRLNDRDEFKAAFRARYPPPDLPVVTEGEDEIGGEVEEDVGGDSDDDIPF